jgi:hypothetical protein
MDNESNVREDVSRLLKAAPTTFFTASYIADAVGYSESYVKQALATMPVERESMKDGDIKGRGKLIVRWGR